MHVILPNFSFEDSLSGRRPGRHVALQRVMNSLAPLIGLIGNSGDIVVVSADGMPSGVPGVLSDVCYMTADQIVDVTNTRSASVGLTPWGWDSTARRLAEVLGAVDPVPSLDSVLAVNRRRFLVGFDTLHEQAGQGFFNDRFGLLCEDFTQLRAGINTLNSHGVDQWVAKPELSAAGRNCLTGHCGELTDNQQNWLRKHLAGSGSVYLEPWLPIMRECGIQMDIAAGEANGTEAKLVGIAELITDRRGRYRGSMLSDREDEFWRPAVEHAALIGRRAAEYGYFGPLGVDCMEVMLPSGRRVLRLCHDINGRLTMGRLALQLQCQVASGNPGVWLHAMASDPLEDSGTSGKHPAFDAADIVEVVKVSPGRIGDEPTAVDSWFYVTSCPEAATDLVQLIRRHVRMQK